MPAEGRILYAEHAQDILAATLNLLHSGDPCALVTSLNIEGGAARELGSLAVISGRGDMIGYLSNGCIDRDIIHHGLAAIDTGQLKHLRYGAGSPYLDLKLPCGGALELVIDPAPDLAALEAALARLLGPPENCAIFCGSRRACADRICAKTCVDPCRPGCNFTHHRAAGGAYGF